MRRGTPLSGGACPVAKCRPSVAAAHAGRLALGGTLAGCNPLMVGFSLCLGDKISMRIEDMVRFFVPATLGKMLL